MAVIAQFTSFYLGANTCLRNFCLFVWFCWFLLCFVYFIWCAHSLFAMRSVILKLDDIQMCSFLKIVTFIFLHSLFGVRRKYNIFDDGFWAWFDLAYVVNGHIYMYPCQYVHVYVVWTHSKRRKENLKKIYILQFACCDEPHSINRYSFQSWGCHTMARHFILLSLLVQVWTIWTICVQPLEFLVRLFSISIFYQFYCIWVLCNQLSQVLQRWNLKSMRYKCNKIHFTFVLILNHVGVWDLRFFFYFDDLFAILCSFYCTHVRHFCSSFESGSFNHLLTNISAQMHPMTLSIYRNLTANVWNVCSIIQIHTHTRFLSNS